MTDCLVFGPAIAPASLRVSKPELSEPRLVASSATERPPCFSEASVAVPPGLLMSPPIATQKSEIECFESRAQPRSKP
jgi:hypothetical protein